MIEVLRLTHRIRRDPRLSTHVALTARAFGAAKVYYSGEHDGSLENSINHVINFQNIEEVLIIKRASYEPIAVGRCQLRTTWKI